MAEKKQPSSKTAKERRAAHRAKVTNVAKKGGESASGQFMQFVDFVREQGVVGLAVGLAIGLQATEFTKVIVGSIITPVVGLLVSEESLRDLTWTAEVAGRSAVFDIGVLIDAFLKFLAVIFVIYFVVHGLKLDRLDKKKEA